MRAAVVALLLVGCGAATPPVSAVAPSSRASVPYAENAQPLEQMGTPVVEITEEAILCDGVIAGDPRPIRDSKRMTRVDGLFSVLRGKRDAWSHDHRGEPFTGIAYFVIDGRTTAVVVKSVMYTAAFAGFPDFRVVVQRPDGTRGELSLFPQIGGPALRQLSTSVHGGLAAEDVQQVVRRNLGRFRVCYEAARARDPKASGRVDPHVVIDESGRVTKSEVVASTFHDPLFDRCIAEGFSALVFPKSTGAPTDVTYPMRFSPGP